MITKLTLTNFKNFKQAEVDFGPLSILVGANAAGKSNVRDALRFLHGLSRGYNLAEVLGEKYAEGGFLQWSGIRGGTKEVCFTGTNSFSVGAELSFKRLLRGKFSTVMRYAYSIGVSVKDNGGAPRVVQESMYRVSPSGHRTLVFDSHPAADAPRQEDPNHLAVRLRRGGDWRSYGPKAVAMASQPVLTQIVELAERQGAIGRVKGHVEDLLQELQSMRFIDFSPEAMRKPSLPGQVILTDRGENLSSVLQSACSDDGLKQALSGWVQELTPMDVVGFDFIPDAQGRILVYLIEEGGRRTSANSASDGTLRFLGMLAALLGPKPAKFYFLEEIDNGIHPTRLTLLMELLEKSSRSGDVQIVASTHSPQVLRLIKEDNLRYATLAYRLKGAAEGRLKPLAEIPDLMELVKKKDIARLHESSWMENAMEFAEGTPKTFPIEEEPSVQ